jgi:hypothetical protein
MDFLAEILDSDSGTSISFDISASSIAELLHNVTVSTITLGEWSTQDNLTKVNILTDQETFYFQYPERL